MFLIRPSNDLLNKTENFQQPFIQVNLVEF